MTRHDASISVSGSDSDLDFRGDGDDWTLGVLAGGHSRRMGRDKATLPFGDERLVDWVIRRCRPGARDVIVARGAVASLDVTGTRVVDDPAPDLGPLAGVFAMLAEVTTKWLVVVACDMPDLDHHTLAILLATARERNVEGVRFTRDGRSQPLPVVFRRDAKPAVQRCLDERRLRLLAPDDEFSVAVVAVESTLGPRAADVLSGCNTTADYERAQVRLVVAEPNTPPSVDVDLK